MGRVELVIKKDDKRQGQCAPRLLVVAVYNKEILEKCWLIAYNFTMSRNPDSALFHEQYIVEMRSERTMVFC
jgi:hypothetical protein